MTFSAGLNGLQVDEGNKDSSSQRSSQTQINASKLVAACSYAYSPPSILSHCRHPKALYTQRLFPFVGTKLLSSRPSK